MTSAFNRGGVLCGAAMMMVVFGLTDAAWADVATYFTRIDPLTLQANARFGNHVAVDGNFVLVSAPDFDNGSNNNSGDAELIELGETGVIAQTQLVPTKRRASDAFGSSVAISGQHAVVGSKKYDTFWNDAGAGLIFDVANPAATPTVVPENVPTNSEFGEAVAVSGNTAFIGGPGVSSDTGQVRVYDHNSGWSLAQSLVHDDAQAGDGFGAEIEVAGGTLVVGAPGVDSSSFSNVGAAYVFGWDGAQWAQQAKLTRTATGAVGSFGRAIAVQGNSIAVGDANAAVSGNSTAGLVYIFSDTGSGWSLTQTIQSPALHSSAFFGTSIDIQGNLMAIGASGDDTQANQAGAVYLYEKSGETWTLTQTLFAPDATSGEFFGLSVEFSEKWLAVGAPITDTGGVVNSGAVHVYEIVPEPTTLTLVVAASGVVVMRRRRVAAGRRGGA